VCGFGLLHNNKTKNKTSRCRYVLLTCCVCVWFGVWFVSFRFVFVWCCWVWCSLLCVVGVLVADLLLQCVCVCVRTCVVFLTTLRRPFARTNRHLYPLSIRWTTLWIFHAWGLILFFRLFFLAGIFFVEHVAQKNGNTVNHNGGNLKIKFKQARVHTFLTASRCNM